MTLTRKQLILIAGLGSGALILGAWGFQLMGFTPCKLCHWQRWPHYTAIGVAVVALLVRWRFLPALGALAAATTSALGVYHTGVEQHWWEGPKTCTSGAIDNLTADQLLDQIMAAPLVRCDEIVWQLFSLSMPSFNALFSAALVLIWLAAWRKHN